MPAYSRYPNESKLDFSKRMARSMVKKGASMGISKMRQAENKLLNSARRFIKKK